MFEKRRSIRKYTAQSVSREQLEMIVDAAALAPSAKNRQPWKYAAGTCNDHCHEHKWQFAL